MKNKMMDRRCAFTLVELLVVLAVISILMALLFPALRQGRSRVQAIACASKLREMETARRLYQSDHRGMPLVAGSPDPSFTWYGALSSYLDTTGQTASVHMRCPAGDAIEEYAQDAVNDWTALDYGYVDEYVVNRSADTVPTFFDFFHGNRKTGVQAAGAVTEPLFEEMLDAYPEKILRHGDEDSINVAFSDGSVQEIQDPAWDHLVGRTP